MYLSKQDAIILKRRSRKEKKRVKKIGRITRRRENSYKSWRSKLGTKMNGTNILNEKSLYL